MKSNVKSLCGFEVTWKIEQSEVEGGRAPVLHGWRWQYVMWTLWLLIYRGDEAGVEAASSQAAGQAKPWFRITTRCRQEPRLLSVWVKRSIRYHSCLSQQR